MKPRANFCGIVPQTAEKRLSLWYRPLEVVQIRFEVGLAASPHSRAFD
jgi:hypothetical protein